MGQKANVNSLQLMNNKDWNSIWYSSPKEYKKVLGQDLALMGYLKSSDVFNNQRMALKIRVCRISKDLLIDLRYFSAEDKQKLELHFDSIREFELLSASLSADEEQAMANLSGLGTLNDNRITVARMHMNLIALAFSAGYTKAATLQVGDGNDGTQYTINGTKLPSFHWISHRIYADGSEGETIVGAEDMHHSIDRLFAQTFGEFLSKLDEYGILDKGISVWCSDLGNGVSHSYNNVPFISVGSGNGFLRTGQHLDFDNLTHNKLFNTYINAFGIRTDDGDYITDFGDPDLEGGVLEDLIS